ncbi:Uu.00g027060.m01.CDS01 [Anthostomella pinea]|uniref:Uu.00g027060.m01.CDS01 n=1 Tax=Anthostomella pinea TaxID=933095 RepID=A0AAI8V2U8_9PEZI|nr:Uu.00g027060.m01.CDS01 [Anthostomella pinea]
MSSGFQPINATSSDIGMPDTAERADVCSINFLMNDVCCMSRCSRPSAEGFPTCEQHMEAEATKWEQLTAEPSIPEEASGNATEMDTEEAIVTHCTAPASTDLAQQDLGSDKCLYHMHLEDPRRPRHNKLSKAAEDRLRQAKGEKPKKRCNRTPRFCTTKDCPLPPATGGRRCERHNAEATVRNKALVKLMEGERIVLLLRKASGRRRRRVL